MSEDDQDSQHLGAPGYGRPRNAVVDIFARMPTVAHPLVRAIEAQAKRQFPLKKWPAVPYHYGMGRLRAYDAWLGRLSEEERAQEIAACVRRYEDYHDWLANMISRHMTELGFEPFDLEKQKTDEQLRELAIRISEACVAPIAMRPAQNQHDRVVGRGRTRRRGP